MGKRRVYANLYLERIAAIILAPAVILVVTVDLCPADV